MEKKSAEKKKETHMHLANSQSIQLASDTFCDELVQSAGKKAILA